MRKKTGKFSNFDSLKEIDLLEKNVEMHFAKETRKFSNFNLS